MGEVTWVKSGTVGRTQARPWKQYVEAEPKLQDIANRLEMDKISKQTARDEIAGLVGFRRMENEMNAWLAAHPPPKGRDWGIWLIEKFNPTEVQRRIYGNQCAAILWHLLGIEP